MLGAVEVGAVDAVARATVHVAVEDVDAGGGGEAGGVSEQVARGASQREQSGGRVAV